MIIDDYLDYTDKYVNIYGNKTLVLMEVGSFFELYGIKNDNEVLGANVDEICDILNIQSSRKNKNILENSRNNPLMAGFPNHALKKFIDILINNKYTIVLIEQTTPPPNPKREVTQIFSPSTYIDNIVNFEANNLLVLFFDEISNIIEINVIIVDLSTGKTFIELIIVDKNRINNEIKRIILSHSPKEVIYLSEKQININFYDNIYYHDKLGKLNEEYKNINYQKKFLSKVYKNTGLLSVIEYLNLEKFPNIVTSFVYTIQFIYEHNENFINNISKPIIINNNNILNLEGDCLTQLNIINNNKCLFNLLNNCCTSIGKRYFKKTLCNPLTDIDILKNKYDTTEKYLNLYKSTRPILKNIIDIERLIRKMSLKLLNPCELVSLYESFLNIKKLNQFVDLNINIDEFIEEINNNLDINICKKYNINGLDENIFIKGLCLKIDDIQLEINKRNEYFEEIIKKDKENFIKLEKNEKEGFILTITSKRYENIKNKFKQFKTKSITPNNKNILKLYNQESIIINQELLELKSELRTNLTNEYLKYLENLYNKYNNFFYESVKYIEEIDYYSNNAYNAIKNNYFKPDIIEGDSFIKAQKLRHPIIEIIQNDKQYISNDINFDNNMKGMLLYGINSIGKSSLMKSIGVNLIMAQCGMFVASDNFQFSPYNKLFTRIVNTDNIYNGQSSFVYEIMELRNILNKADKNSIVLADEIIQSTESISSISLVASVIMKLNEIKSTFICATHIHELIKLDEIKELNTVKPYHLSIHYCEKTNQIIYDRILKEGPTNTLYGIEVCKSLDLDPDFLHNANKIRQKLLDIPEKILDNKKSIYNSKIYKDRCKICESNANDVHHIKYQKNADKNGFINNFHKNREFNLINVCEKCHNSIHNEELIIHGYIQTENGLELNYEWRKTENELDKKLIKDVKKNRTYKNTLEILMNEYKINISMYKLKKIVLETI